MIDKFQIGAIAFEMGLAVALSVYFGVFGEPGKKYVSDLLFELVSYQVVVTVCISAQTLLCFAFLFRQFMDHVEFLRSYYDYVSYCVASFSLVVSIAGWVTLNVEYRAADGSTSAVHIWGTLVFVIGVILYFTTLLTMILPYLFKIGSDVWHTVMGSAIIVLFLASLVCIVVFGWKFVSNESQGWIYEHAAFILMVVSHAFLFGIQTPSPFSGKMKIDVPTQRRFYIPVDMGTFPRAQS
jgi:hypothetical protein